MARYINTHTGRYGNWPLLFLAGVLAIFNAGSTLWATRGFCVATAGRATAGTGWSRMGTDLGLVGPTAGWGLGRDKEACATGTALPHVPPHGFTSTTVTPHTVLLLVTVITAHTSCSAAHSRSVWGYLSMSEGLENFASSWLGAVVKDKGTVAVHWTVTSFVRLTVVPNPGQPPSLCASEGF